MTTQKISRVQYMLWWIIFVQALVATLGSLYYSSYGDPAVNILAGQIFHPYGGFIPCSLCWYARILMYPITIISLIGILKKDKRFTDYILIQSLVGIGLEIFHYTIQHVKLPIDMPCTLESPCTALQVNYLGFITIPFLCLVAFIVIFVASVLNMYLNKKAAK